MYESSNGSRCLAVLPNHALLPFVPASPPRLHSFLVHIIVAHFRACGEEWVPGAAGFSSCPCQCLWCLLVGSSGKGGRMTTCRHTPRGDGWNRSRGRGSHCTSAAAGRPHGRSGRTGSTNRCTSCWSMVVLGWVLVRIVMSGIGCWMSDVTLCVLCQMYTWKSCLMPSGKLNSFQEASKQMVGPLK